MKPTITALALTTLSMFWGTAPAVAGDTKVARGTIASMAGQSVTVTVGDRDMTFRIDSKTFVQVREQGARQGGALKGRRGPLPRPGKGRRSRQLPVSREGQGPGPPGPPRPQKAPEPKARGGPRGPGNPAPLPPPDPLDPPDLLNV